MIQPIELKVLVEGYARQENGVEYASSTAILIKQGNLNVLVDPGSNYNYLRAALIKDGLSSLSINFVVLTHYHLDHCLLAGMFTTAKVLDNSEIYAWDSSIRSHVGKVPGTGIKLISTPGHDPFHCSVLVKTKEFGRVAIASDVFWWPDNQKQKTDKQSLLNLKDPYVKNKADLLASRKKIWGLADWIVPGHGKMFKVK